MPLLAAGLLTLSVFASAPASANLPGSTFEGGDGNLVVNTAGNTDWANVAGLSTGVDLPSGSADNSFGQGTKEDNPAVTIVTGSIPPNKNDLTRFYEASELRANGHNYLYLSWERAVNLGNANLDFEISQNTTSGFTNTKTGALTLNRTAGDLLVTYDFSGSGTPTLAINRWLTGAAGNTAGQCYSASALPCWGNHIALNGTDSEGAVSTGSVVDPLQSGSPTLGTGLFGEAAIDLTAAGVFPAGTCQAFGSAFVKSRSSSSFTAEIKDFIAPIPVNISNCGSITIHKVTENGDSSFAYATTGGLSPATFNLSNGGTQSYTAVPIGNYTVTESTFTAAQQAAGWTLKSLTCTATGAGTSYTIAGATASITMGAEGALDCTYTNHVNLNPTIATTLSATTVNVGDSLHDSATLTGATAGAGGTMTYHAYAGANTCTGTDLLNSTVTVTNGGVPDSASFTPTAAGYYSFQASYSGDSNNNPATSSCSSEQLLVRTNPSISTSLSATSVVVGSTVHDSATLSGETGDAGGSVTYSVYTDAGCSAGQVDAGTVTVTNGGVPDSNAITFNKAGTYYWQAVYTGDTKNNPVTSTCTSEQLVVAPQQPSVSTAQDLLPNDTFILSGGFAPTGTITFSLYAPSDATCSGNPAYTQTVTVSGNGSYSTSNTTFLATTEGTWRWQSSYSGDANNLGAASACGTEQFTIANH